MNLHGRKDLVSQIDKRDINGHLRHIAKYKAIKAICLTYTTTHRHAVNRMTESFFWNGNHELYTRLPHSAFTPHEAQRI